MNDRTMIRGWPAVQQYIPLSKTRLQQLVAAGKLKAPIKLGPRTPSWFLADVLEAQERYIREQEARA
jgi:predicted DNA-binding transcriptional regulator AlpA